MRREKIILLLILLMVISIYLLAEENPIERGADINRKDYKNYFPYQEGYPVQIYRCNQGPLSTLDLYRQTFQKRKKGVFIIVKDKYFKMHNFVYDQRGEVVATPDYGAGPPAYVDINFDGIDEIIAVQNCPQPWDCYGLGAVVARLNGWKLNGFPNPPNTHFVSPSIEDIDRDGNYDIAFSSLFDKNPFKEVVGTFILGSWGGVFPGFPVLYPLWDPVTPTAPGSSYKIAPIGDFDEDGFMEVLAVTLHGYTLIRMDGSFYRNWPIGIYGMISYAVLVDIDNDGKLEILSNDTNFTDSLFAFNEDGSYVKGYPIRWLLNKWPTYAVVADTNEDGVLEIYFSVGCLWDKLILGYDQYGNVLPNFPIPNISVDGQPVGHIDVVPTIADIDGDGEMEILLAGLTCNRSFCPDGVIYAFNLDGTLVEGFPIVEWFQEFTDGLTIDDLDGDGDIEICVATCSSCYDDQPNYLYCYDLPYKYNPDKVVWKNTSNSDLHTNRYFDLRVKVPSVKNVQPNIGSYKGGTRVVIKGENFQEGARVFFGGIEAKDVQVIDSETIYAITPAHKPCFGYINDISVSPYELSFKLVNQPVVVDETQLGEGRKVEEYYVSGYLGGGGNGCIVNVVVAHPSPDQREGILRAGFTYTGYESLRDDITLYVSKHIQKGTFENGLSYWQNYARDDNDFTTLGSWHVVEDGKSNCIQRYGSNNKFIWFGNEDTCIYDTGYGVRNAGCIESPVIYLEDEESAMSFWYYRDVEFNYFMLRAITEILIQDYGGNGKWSVIWHKDSTYPSEKQWTWSGWIPLGKYAGKYVHLRVCFDNVIGIQGNYRGWAIDDLQFRNARWRQDTSEIILEWEGGIPKYLVYRSKGPNYQVDVPELRGYTSLNRYVENSYNNDESYYYKVR